jgi:hypothetical protein
MNRRRLFCAAVLILAAQVPAQMDVAAQAPTNGPFQILNLQPIFDPIAGSNAYVVTWNAATGLVNYVTYTQSPGMPWQNLAGYFANYGPTTMVATDYPPAGTTQRFYQVRAAMRPHVIMSLVLDRSGSMFSNGGVTALPPAVTNFISLFNDNYDYAAQVSFSSAASVDVPMEQPFITNIQDGALGLPFGGNTCSDQGLTNALAQIDAVAPQLAGNVVNVIVFFTDGMANTFNYVFNCGARNIGYSGPTLYNPANGNVDNTGCTVPTTLSSIDPFSGDLTPNAVDADGTSQTSCVSMHNEAENRAERIAWLARSQGITIYCIGMGSPGVQGECVGAFPVLNPVFLDDVANTPDSETYDPTQPVGISVIATNASALQAVFQSIAQQLLSQ